MLRLTLDTNCIIALDEKREPAASSLGQLLAAHHAGSVQLRLVASSGAERQQHGAGYLANFSQFKERLTRLRLDHLEILSAPATLDVAYLNSMVLLNRDEIRLLKRIHDVLFSTHPFERQDVISMAPPETDPDDIEYKWRNRRLDCEAVWCHIYFKGDVFVTTDKNFLSKRAQLAPLGVQMILTPADAVVYISGRVVNHGPRPCPPTAAAGPEQ